MTQPKENKPIMDDPAETKYEPAERKEMDHERPSRKERNKKWMT